MCLKEVSKVDGEANKEEDRQKNTVTAVFVFLVSCDKDS